MFESLLMISVQSQNFFVHARMVQEILGERVWIPIPGACKEIPGVVQWNRRAVAMLDLGRVVADLRPLEPGESRPRMLMLRVNESNLALPTDAVSAILDVDAANIRPRTVSDFSLSRNEVLLNEEVIPLLERKPLTECLMAPFARAATLPGDAERSAQQRSSVEWQAAKPTRRGSVRLARAPSGAG